MVEQIGKYKILEEIGSGGVGVVYRAYDERMDREVAIKVLSDWALQLPEIKARFYREARTAGKLSHRNIAIIHEVDEADGRMFIAMEMLHGDDLRGVISRKDPLPFGKMLDYAIQICDGLRYAHDHGIIHRDIKPENIKVLANGAVKIIDFGIAKPDPSTAEGDNSIKETLTQVGVRVGTPWYMSPEQIQGTPLDRRSDIFSFGVMFYEMLTYSRPFDGTDTTVMYKICHEEPKKAVFAESDLSTRVQEIILQCLAKKREDRYPDCTKLQEDLVALLDKVHLPVVRADGQATLVQLRDTDPGSRPLDLINPGDVISHYRIIGRIGGGGVGNVFKALDPILNRTVALKVLRSELMHDTAFKERLLKEARAASSLDHRNICTIYEIGEDKGKMFIAMAYYDGKGLGKMIEEGGIGLQEAISILYQVADGLTVAHEHGLVHGDVKPANIIVTTNLEPRILDFGLAEKAGVMREANSMSSAGTPAFLAPEQVRGEAADERSDIWSFGVLMYYLFSYRLPFQSDSQEKLTKAILEQEPAPLSELVKTLPKEVSRLVSRTLRKDMRKRISSMKEVRDELSVIEQQFAQ